MPPRFLRRASPTRLKPCQERTFEACDTTPTDQCCGVVPCKLCIEWESYDGDIVYGSAEFQTSSWTGSAGDGSFVAYWERSAYDECEFVVVFDGDEVYRATCYQGASCRNPSGEVAASIGYEDGTLRWGVYQPRELPLVDDPDTGCRDFFCGTCRCTCECLCVTITPYNGDIFSGELCDTAYDCSGPVWAGTIGYYELSFALGRDQYGECTITATVDGEEHGAVSASGCTSLTASITMANGDLIEIRCKECSCDDGTDSTLCCTGRCYPGVDSDPGNCPGLPSDNPQPTTLTVEMTTDDSTYGCFTATGTVTLVANGRWGNGTLTGTCSWHDPTDSTAPFVTWNFQVLIAIQCTSGDGWGIEFRRPFFETDPHPSFIPTDFILAKVSCDPVMLSGTTCYNPGMSSVVFPIVPPQPPLQHPDICLSFLVYETP